MFFYYQPSTILTLGTNSEAQSGRLWKKLGIYEIVIEPCACTCVINIDYPYLVSRKEIWNHCPSLFTEFRQ